MTKRQIVIDAITFKRPPYVPWQIGLTGQCAQRLSEHAGPGFDLNAWLDGHFVGVGQGGVRVSWQADDGRFVKDMYGVTWDRSIDQDIGTPCDWPIKQPSDLDHYCFPDANQPDWYAGCKETLASFGDRFSAYSIGFSLFERAWTLRGMEDLLMDMVERPEFVEELLDRIVEHNLDQVRHGLALGVDAVHFGDDYGMQTGLIMGARHWRRFIKPRLARMFEPVRRAGKFISMHSCGCVQEVFDDLVEIGLNLFNPFQPEVMDVFEIMRRYRGRLAFHGGLSIQKVLPFGTVGEVRAATRRLLEVGAEGGYVFSPSHAVPRDVPPANLLVMMEELKAQAGRDAE